MVEYNITPERAEAVWKKVGGDNRVDMLLDGFLVVRQKRKSLFKSVGEYSCEMKIPACDKFHLQDFQRSKRFKIPPLFSMDFSKTEKNIPDSEIFVEQQVAGLATSDRKVIRENLKGRDPMAMYQLYYFLLNHAREFVAGHYIANVGQWYSTSTLVVVASSGSGCWKFIKNPSCTKGDSSFYLSCKRE